MPARVSARSAQLRDHPPDPERHRQRRQPGPPPGQLRPLTRQVGAPGRVDEVGGVGIRLCWTIRHRLGSSTRGLTDCHLREYPTVA